MIMGQIIAGHPPAPTIKPDRLYTPEQSAEFLAVTPQELEEWREAGCGPAWIPLPPALIRYAGHALLEVIWPEPIPFEMLRDPRELFGAV